MKPTPIALAALAIVVSVAAASSGTVAAPGFWIRVGNKYPNPVLSLDQQYQP